MALASRSQEFELFVNNLIKNSFIVSNGFNTHGHEGFQSRLNAHLWNSLISSFEVIFDCQACGGLPNVLE